MITSTLVNLLAVAVTAVTSVSASQAKLPNPEGFDERRVAIRTHSIQAPYVDQELQNRWWDFGADAIVNTNKHIRLTQDRQSEMGWLWSRLPLKAENFEIQVEFKIDGKGQSLYGDGFAMWLTTERAKPGPVFGSVDKFKGLGLFFDTYPNSRHSYSFPRATAMLGDGKTAYDHDHDNQNTELAGCSFDFRNTKRDNGGTLLKLTYLKGVSLGLQLKTEPTQWTNCFLAEAVHLPDEDFFIGFSALTGDVSDAHDIISVETSVIVLDHTSRALPHPDAMQEAQHSRGSNSGRSTAGSVFIFLFKALGVVAFIAFAISAYRSYDVQKRGKRF